MNPARKNPRLVGFLRCQVAVLIVLTALCGRCEVCAKSSNVPKRVLVLYWYNKDYLGNILFDQAFQAALQSQHPQVEYYPEYLETNRFAGEALSRQLADYLRQKYANHRIDVVVAVSDAALDFLLQHRSDLFTEIPLVFTAIRRLSNEQINNAPGMTGIVPANTHRQTVELALRLHPYTEQLFVVSGTPERDKRFENVARSELQDYENRLTITYLTDLPLAELIAKSKSLPKRSIMLYLWQQSQDSDGRLLETYDTLDRFAPYTSAPIYGMGGGNLGHGIVGGYLVTSESAGTKTAEIALQIINGKKPQDIPIENAPALPMFDWRELQRWEINQQSLPPGSIVRFREFTFWEQYKWRIIGILLLFLLQTFFIAILLVERRKRRRAKEALDLLNADLEDRIAVRTAALDAKSKELETFAYSVAHDLKAPLRGIDGYSRLLLEDHAKSLDDEGRFFLDTIQASAEEMRQLIDDLLSYSRLERRDFTRSRVELQTLIAKLVDQKKREESSGRIDFVLDVNGATVVADENGLAQSLSNYLDNAVKFTADIAQPRIEIGVKEGKSNCLLYVRDNGIGFDPKYRDRIFDIFQRLNPAEAYPGTGVGLAIVRKAMERMGGRAWAESEPGHGATFYLDIPKNSGEKL
jgi:signal transduction histidine kinase